MKAMKDKLQNVKYIRCDYGSLDKPYEAPLLFFVYDIPYFASCDVFPPFSIINNIFKSGGNSGGMGPGATWEPFSISEREYERLVEDVRTTSITIIKEHSRYADVGFIIDSSFDHIQDHIEWSREIFKKYGFEWLRRMNPEIYGQMDNKSLRDLVKSMAKAPTRGSTGCRKGKG